MNARTIHTPILCVLCLLLATACDDSRSRQVDHALAAAKDSLATLVGPCCRQRIATRMTEQLDTLLTMTREGRRANALRLDRAFFALAANRNSIICASDSLLTEAYRGFNSIAISDHTGSAQVIVSRLGAIMQRLRTQDVVVRDFLLSNPSDPEMARLSAMADSLAIAKDTICLWGLMFVALDVSLLTTAGDVTCSTVEDVWRTAIERSAHGYLGFDLNQLGVICHDKIEQASGSYFDGLCNEPRSFLVTLDPGQGVAKYLYDEATNWFLTSASLMDLARNPRGSLLSYHSEHSRLRSEAETRSERFRMEYQKAAAALGRQELAAEFRKRL